MKKSILILYFGISLVLTSHIQANEKSNSETQGTANDPTVFATVNGTPLGLNLYHFLLGFREQDSLERQAQDDSFDAEMNRQQTAKDLVMTELLAQQAMRLGMHETEQVKVEMTMAEKTLLAQLYVKQIMDAIEIPESQIRQYYDQQKDQALYRFMIWRTTDQDRAQEILAALKGGKDADASDVTETPWLRDVDIAPEVNDIVRELSVNNFADKPVFQDGFWKVVQVIDKQVMAKQSFDEEREIIKAELMRQKLDEQLEKLAKSASIVFNDQHVTQQTQ